MQPQTKFKPLTPLSFNSKRSGQPVAQAIPRKYGPFTLRSDGVFHTTKKEKQEFICSPLEVVARSRDEGGQEWGYVLCWKDADGIPRTWSAPASLTVTNDTELAQALVNAGLTIAPGKGTQLRKYIVEVKPTKRMTNVSRPGWHKVRNKRLFALPDKIAGAGGEQDIILQQGTYSGSTRVTSGTMEEWKENVAAMCIGNDHLVFGVSIAFAAPTLELLGKASGGFHLHGLSSSGKSTALSVAASVWGYPVQTWRTTDNALEDTAERHNDVLLPLDELSQIDAKKAAETAYMLGNGEGKQRLNQSIMPQQKKRWRLLFLSTGEVTLADHVETAGGKAKAGTEVRMVNLDADAGAGMGIFQDVHGVTSPAAFADSLKTNATQWQGTAGPEFVEYLINKEAEAKEKLGKLIGDFIQENVPPESSGEIYRVAERFALVGAAGELATEAGITGWPEGAAMKAARSLFLGWLSKRSTGSSDMDKAVSQVKGFLLANPSRFEDLSEDGDQRGFPKWGSKLIINRAGFVQAGPDGRNEYLIPSESFKEICKGYDATRVAKELEKRGYLRRGQDRLQVQQRIPGVGNLRFYAIQSSIFEEGTDESPEPPEAEAAA